MKRRVPRPGDHVRIEGDRHLYRVEARTKDGRLTLEALGADPRVRVTDMRQERARITETVR